MNTTEPAIVSYETLARKLLNKSDSDHLSNDELRAAQRKLIGPTAEEMDDSLLRSQPARKPVEKIGGVAI